MSAKVYLIGAVCDSRARVSGASDSFPNWLTFSLQHFISTERAAYRVSDEALKTFWGTRASLSLCIINALETPCKPFCLEAHPGGHT